MRSYKDITWRYLKQQWKRTLLTLTGIVLAVALITAIGTMVVSIRDVMIRQAINDTGDYHVHYTSVKAGQADKIRNHSGVSEAALVKKEGYAVISRVSEKEREGDVPPYRYLKLNSYDGQAFKMFPLSLWEGRLPRAPGELLVDYWVLDYLPGDAGLGDTVSLQVGTRARGDSNTEINEYRGSRDEVFKVEKEVEFTIVGLLEPRIESSGNYFANGITLLNSRTLEPGNRYEAYVKMDSVVDVKDKAEAIASAAGLGKQVAERGNSGYPIAYNNKLLKLSGQSTDNGINSTLFMLVGFIILLVMVSAIAVIYNAFNISVLERVSQFGILRCTGATPGQVKSIVFREAGILSILGIPLGLACGVLAVEVVIYLINLFSAYGLDYLFRFDFQVVKSPAVFVAGAVLGLVTVYLSALGPAKQAARVSPLEAARNTGSYKVENLQKARKSRLAQLFFGFEGQLAYKNLRRNRKRFRVTVFSMTISIVLFIVFGSFVNYMFQVEAVGGVPDVDFLLSVREEKEGSFTPERYQELKKLPGVERVFKDIGTGVTMGVPEDKVNSRFARLKGDWLEEKREGLILYPRGRLVSYGEAAVPELKKILHVDSLDAMNRQNGVVLVTTSRTYDPVKEKPVLVKAFDYEVGDRISVLAGEEKEFKTVKVMKILDKSFLDNSYNGDGKVSLITTEEVYEKIAGNNHYRQVAIRLAEGANPGPVAEYLRNLSQQDPGYEYVNVAKVLGEMRNQAIVMSIFMYGFVAIIALIGSVNIINTVSTNLILRKREFSVLRAVGMTQNGIKKMVGLEGVMYGLVAAVYGGITGTVLSYLLYLIIVDVTEFAWSMPWSDFFIAALGAILIALVSAYVPLRKINRGNIIDNIRLEE